MTKAITMVLDRIEAQQNQLDLGPTATALDLLQAVYRNPSQDLHIRMRAASIAIAYESPKLIAQAVLNEGSFAELLDRRLKRLNEMKLIESNGATPAEQSEIEPTIKSQAEPVPPSTSKPAPSPLRRLYNPKLYPRRV